VYARSKPTAALVVLTKGKNIIIKPETGQQTNQQASPYSSSSFFSHCVLMLGENKSTKFRKKRETVAVVGGGESPRCGAIQAILGNQLLYQLQKISLFFFCVCVCYYSSFCSLSF